MPKWFKIRINKEDITIIVFMTILLYSRLNKESYSSLIMMSVFGAIVLICNLSHRFLKIIFAIVAISTLLLVISFYKTRNFFYINHILMICFYLPYAITVYKGGFSKEIISRYCLFIEMIVLGAWIVYRENNIFLVISRNSISSLLMLFLLPLVSSNNKFDSIKKEILILHAILVFGAAITLNGRGGIVSTGIILVGFLFVYVFGEKNISLRRQMGRILIILLALLAIGYILSHIGILQIIFERFYEKKDVGLSNEPRTVIIRQYLDNLNDISSILFGVEINKVPLMMYYAGNPHNSIINIHMYYGLSGLMLVLLIIIHWEVKLICEKKLYFAVLLLGMFIRAFTDQLWGGAPFDVFIYYLVLASILNEKPNVDKLWNQALT